MELFIKRVLFCVMIFVSIIIFIMCISYIISLFKIDVSKYEVVSNKIPKSFNGFKILQLSDIHNRKFNKDNKKVIKIIEAASPDIVVITGDIVSADTKGLSPMINFIKEINKKYPVYYVFGNHERRLPIEKQALIIATLKDAGVKILNNEVEFINKGDEYIQLYGLEQSLVYYNNYFKSKKSYSYEEKDIKQVFPGIDNDKFNILLTHNPLYFETYEKWGADLVFAGHVHGGIVNIPFVGGLLSPERKLFPKYSGGEYEINNSKMIVNRGLGYSTINFRVLNNPEVCVVELKSE